MTNRVGLVLLAALLCGGLAAFLAYKFLREDPAVPGAQATEVSLTKVAVATRDMDVGRVLQATDVKLVDWPASVLPAGYSTSPSDIVGRGLLTPVKTNEPLLSGKLARKEAGGGLPIMIPEGMRAMTVKVDQVVGVAGFAIPGTRVDILVTLDQIANLSEPITQIVLQRIEVLTAGQAIERDTEGKPLTVPVVTLLVDPEQAEKLTIATQKGRIQLALRNTLDMDTVSTPGAQPRDLLIRPQRVAQAPVRRSGPVAPSRVSVEVWKGPKQESQTVDANRSTGGGS